MKSITIRILFTSLVVITLGLQHVVAQAPAKAADLIAMKAMDFKLGSPRPESPTPRQTPLPRNEGWWQAFEGGWVYWTPGHGAHVVRGRIFEAWAREGWEQGTLGFPMTDEATCRVPNSGDRYQRFEGGVVYWQPANNSATVYHNDPQIGQTFGVNGVCYPTQVTANQATTSPATTNTVAPNISTPAEGPVPAPPPRDKKPDPAPRAQGLFRITIDNFRAERVVHNGLLDAGDDVFLMWDAQEFNADGRQVGGPLAGQSQIYGDMGRNRAQIQAGTQGDNGGIRAGDKISGRSAPSANRLPMLVGDFMLTDGENAFLFVPTIWTAENDVGELAYRFRQRFQLRTRFAAHDVRKDLEDPRFARFHWTWSGSRGPDDWLEIRYPWGMNNIRGDHPIGHWHFWIQMNEFNPHTFLLTYKTVTTFMELAGGQRPVQFDARYADASGGEYYIVMTIERVK